MKMYLTKFIIIAYTLVLLNAVTAVMEENPVNVAFKKICKVYEKIPKANGKLACSIGKLFLKDKFVYQIPKDKCELIPVNRYGITEICSEPPYQLYFKPSNYYVNGCYKLGTPNKDFMQCCQFRHDFVFKNPMAINAPNAVAEVYQGYFCSGPNSKDKSFKSVPAHGLTYNLSSSNKDTLLYYTSKVMSEECGKDQNSQKCKKAIKDFDTAFDEKTLVNWHPVAII